MDQVRVKTGAAHLADQRDTEEPSRKTCAVEQRKQEQPVKQNGQAVVEEIVHTGVPFGPKQEQAPVYGGKSHRLGNTACKLLLEKIKTALAVQPKKHHAKQVFENTNRSENMEEAILGLVAAKPQVVRSTKENCPQNPRNEQRTKQNPKRPVLLTEKPTAEPRRNGVAHKEAGQGPRRLIQFHSQVRNDRPGKGKVQEQASPGVRHLGKARRSTVANFKEAWQMGVTAELENQHHEHQNRHEKMQAIELRDAGKHEGDYGNTAFRIAELACKQEPGKHVEDARRKGGGADDGHEPFPVVHIAKGTRTAQVEHHNIYAGQKPKPVNGGKVVGLGHATAVPSCGRQNASAGLPGTCRTLRCGNCPACRGGASPRYRA